MDSSLLYRSKAPFRLGIAGGGTDVSPYSDLYGGAVLNVTINRFACATLRPLDNGKIRFVHIDDACVREYDAAAWLEPEAPMQLQCGIYNRIVRQFNDGKPLSFELVTRMDVPSGSGLGTSSTLAVAILGAFTEACNLPLGRYDIARLAYEIERIDLGMAGGRQDQYAATFGGVNFMEFLSDDRVIVNPLSIPDRTLNEWALNTVLLYTNKRRESARIIEEQMHNVQQKKAASVEAMHRVKEEAFRMKKCLLQNKLHELGPALNTSWVNKKKMAGGISNEFIDSLYETALNAGATGGKISGAGGGGFLFFYCPGNTRYAVEAALSRTEAGEIYPIEFCKEGLTTWTAQL